MLTDSQRSHLTKCKVSLYIALSDVQSEEISEADLDMMYVLSKDPYIQRILSKKSKEETDDNSSL